MACEDQGECANCKSPFEGHSSRSTSILSTWSNRKDNHSPELISVYEALAVVFEIPPLTPNCNEDSPNPLSKKEIFKRSSRFTSFFRSGNQNEDEEGNFEGGYALCYSCSETLTLAYNSLQEFVAVCKLESDIGRILKELEIDKDLQSKGIIREKVNDNLTLQNSTGTTCESADDATIATSTERKEQGIPRVIIKSEPRDDEENYEDDLEQSEAFSQTNESEQACFTNMSDGDDNDNGVSRPGSPDCYNSENDVKGKAATIAGRMKILKSEDTLEDETIPQRRSLRLRQSTNRADLDENDISDDSDLEERKPKKSGIQQVKIRSRLKQRRGRRIDSDDGDEYVPPVKASYMKQRRPVFAVPSRSMSRNKKTLAVSKHSKLNQLECPKCKKLFLHENTLICHRRLVHRENIAVTRPTMTFSGQSIQNKSEQHLRSLASTGGKTSTCPVCRLEVPRNEIRLHLSTHTRSLSKPWLCTICGVECSNQASLYAHHSSMHKSCVPCKRCGANIPKFKMIMHMRSCSKQNGGSGSFSCKKCDQTFRSSVHLMEHRSSVHGHVWKCKLCGNKFSVRSKMIQHMQTHSKKKAYKCKICDKAYGRSDVLRLHVKRFHRNEGPPSVLKSASLETGDDPQNDSMKDTTQTGNSKAKSDAVPPQTDISLVEPVKEDRFICKPCETAFRYFNDLEEHMLQIHADIESSSCKICTRKFQDSYCLRLHMKFHSETKPLTCFICSKNYKDRNTFFYHIKDIHKLNSKVIIAKYPDVFSVYVSDPDRPFVKKTMRTAPRRPMARGEFPCEICGKIFPYLGGVKRHIKVVHEQVRDFMCSYCGKGFAKKSYFILHEKLHTTTDAPYKCHLCGTI
ncbi:unnamed protein product [Orchesella dallaii]|uniref:C2H2-type domain-containing protein n=1 Tax=Orchesella dallaii TaxID=48710 RepID=A0ABP1S3L8_9HEXA